MSLQTVLSHHVGSENRSRPGITQKHALHCWAVLWSLSLLYQSNCQLQTFQLTYIFQRIKVPRVQNFILLLPLEMPDGGWRWSCRRAGRARAQAWESLAPSLEDLVEVSLAAVWSGLWDSWRQSWRHGVDSSLQAGLPGQAHEDHVPGGDLPVLPTH